MLVLALCNYATLLRPMLARLLASRCDVLRDLLEVGWESRKVRGTPADHERDEHVCVVFVELTFPELLKGSGHANEAGDHLAAAANLEGPLPRLSGQEDGAVVRIRGPSRRRREWRSAPA